MKSRARDDPRQQILERQPETLVVALGNPYLMVDFPQIKTYLCTYAMATTSEVSVARALFGEISNHAKLPVTLPGIDFRGLRTNSIQV